MYTKWRHCNSIHDDTLHILFCQIIWLYQALVRAACGRVWISNIFYHRYIRQWQHTFLYHLPNFTLANDMFLKALLLIYPEIDALVRHYWYVMDIDNTPLKLLSPLSTPSYGKYRLRLFHLYPDGRLDFLWALMQYNLELFMPLLSVMWLNVPSCRWGTIDTNKMEDVPLEKWKKILSIRAYFHSVNSVWEEECLKIDNCGHNSA